METDSGVKTAPGAGFVEARLYPRYKLEAEIRVYVRNREVVRGHTVDISESGISAMLREEIRLDEIVRLEFALPDGEIEIHATVRQRNAFRYGFQFLELDGPHQLIRRTCRELAIEQNVRQSPES